MPFRVAPSASRKAGRSIIPFRSYASSDRKTSFSARNTSSVSASRTERAFSRARCNEKWMEYGLFPSMKNAWRYGIESGANAATSRESCADGKIASMSFQAVWARSSASPWVSVEKSSVTRSRRVMFSARSRYRPIQ